jgi:hypothetical protein
MYGPAMPIVAIIAIDLLDMAVLRLTLAPFQHHPLVGQEHGRTIPLALVRHPAGSVGRVNAGFCLDWSCGVGPQMVHYPRL